MHAHRHLHAAVNTSHAHAWITFKTADVTIVDFKLYQRIKMLIGNTIKSRGNRSLRIKVKQIFLCQTNLFCNGLAGDWSNRSWNVWLNKDYLSLFSVILFAFGPQAHNSPRCPPQTSSSSSSLPFHNLALSSKWSVHTSPFPLNNTNAAHWVFDCVTSGLLFFLSLVDAFFLLRPNPAMTDGSVSRPAPLLFCSLSQHCTKSPLLPWMENTHRKCDCMISKSSLNHS